MKKLKSYFSTPKKTLVSVLCLAALLTLLGIGTAFTVSAVAESRAIGAEAAAQFAFADAGIDPATATLDRTEFDFERGEFLYEVEFTANGTEYDYGIRANTGSVVYRQSEPTHDGIQTTPDDNTQTTQEPTTSAKITLEEARQVALTDAGLSAGAVRFDRGELDWEDGTLVYEVEFTANATEYDYAIDATTGAIFRRSSDNNDKISATTSATPAAETGYIRVEQAKTAAVNHAGFTLDQVSFRKAKLENDDGRAVYEIEFLQNNVEYDYEIDASSGTILDYSRDTDD